jgi:hypothetical protein
VSTGSPPYRFSPDRGRRHANAGRTCSGSSECGFEQVITVNPNTTYTLRGWAKLANAGDVHDRLRGRATTARERTQLERATTGWRWAAG